MAISKQSVVQLVVQLYTPLLQTNPEGGQQTIRIRSTRSHHWFMLPYFSSTIVTSSTSNVHFFLFTSQSTGLHFTLDPSSCSKRELVFTRDLSVAKLTSPVIASVEGNLALSNGCHYWKTRIDQFIGSNNNGFIAVGVARKLVDGAPIGEVMPQIFKMDLTTIRRKQTRGTLKSEFSLIFHDKS